MDSSIMWLPSTGQHVGYWQNLAFQAACGSLDPSLASEALSHLFQSLSQDSVDSHQRNTQSSSRRRDPTSRHTTQAQAWIAGFGTPHTAATRTSPSGSTPQTQPTPQMRSQDYSSIPSSPFIPPPPLPPPHASGMPPSHSQTQPPFDLSTLYMTPGPSQYPILPATAFPPQIFCTPIDPCHFTPAQPEVRTPPRFFSGLDSSHWVPHPQPHPWFPPGQFWGPDNTLLGGYSNSPSLPLQTRDFHTVSGGNPAPGINPHWSPLAWPPLPYPNAPPVLLAPWLVPNPQDSSLPQIRWDVAQMPVQLLRYDGGRLTSFDNNMLLQATHSFGRSVHETVHIRCNTGCAGRSWGPIVAHNPLGVTIADVLKEIYDYFQVMLNQAEVDYIHSLHPNNQRLLTETWNRRCATVAGGHVAHVERRAGLKRVDALGNNRRFWGMWIQYNSDSSWHLNLGLRS